MEKKENGEVITNDEELKVMINKSYCEGAIEMTKQLKKLFETNINNFSVTVMQQFDNILDKLTGVNEKK